MAIKDELEGCKKIFLEWIEKRLPIKIVAAQSPDGIVAASIALLLFRATNHVSIRFVSSLTPDVLSQLTAESYPSHLFLGVGTVEMDAKADAVVLNPHTQDQKQVCASTLLYLIASKISKEVESLCYMCAAAAYSEGQHDFGFIGPNNELCIEAAEALRQFEQTVGLRLNAEDGTVYGALQQSLDPVLSHLTATPAAVASFLQTLWPAGYPKKLSELSSQQIKELALALHKTCGVRYEDIVGPLYVLKSGEAIHQIASLLECSAVGAHCSLGVGFCLGDQTATQKVRMMAREIKEEVLHALFELSVQRSRVLGGEQYLVVSGGDLVTARSALRVVRSLLAGEKRIEYVFLSLHFDEKRNLYLLCSSVFPASGQKNPATLMKAIMGDCEITVGRFACSAISEQSPLDVGDRALKILERVCMEETLSQ